MHYAMGGLKSEKKMELRIVHEKEEILSRAAKSEPLREGRPSSEHFCPVLFHVLCFLFLELYFLGAELRIELGGRDLAKTRCCTEPAGIPARSGRSAKRQPNFCQHYGANLEAI